MKRVFAGFVICLFLLNCTKKEEKIVPENIPYIISKEDIKPKPTKQSNNNQIPPTPPPPPNSPIPGWLVYGTNTFIIDTDSKIYYFQRNSIGMICGTETADTIPHFINLQPKDLIEIPNKNIYDFIKLNYKDDFRNVTFIASKTDTLNSKAFFDLRKTLESSIKGRDFYLIRRTTQEEDTVLKYKKNNEYYYSDKIRWDKTKIKFPKYKIED
ncbi:hypothetical protein [Flavobacterium hydatis]|uniref:Uncharacterized protein n=1 Tax=Flavobacterium hydatis TaxID=991 RepID=A0A086AHR4_FLAHY|nr:hypothetical protein [Flavobacterium hydatis]KFF16228.1 hypothetical protein IW20_10710 [Flavobacterium hydatis]OXA96750.1 hypothetical protein B0A62_05705 [Flavobacterium hydatis]